MQKIKRYIRNLYKIGVKGLPLAGLLLVLTIFSLGAVYTYTRGAERTHVYAATSSTINFQARLLTNTGSLVPDGYYNIEFNLYTAASGGTADWTETRTGANKVRVVNGYLSVGLGEVTAFPGTINWDQDHWLTMNIGGSGAPTWDGEMTPRLKLTAVPYAFQAKQSETLNKVQGANTGVLDFLSLTANRALYLPDKNGTLCVNGSSDCVDVVTTNTTATTSSNSGLEISSDGLRLLGGCTEGQALKWDATAKVWKCSSDSVASIGVNETDGSPTTAATTIQFGAPTNSSDEFIITDQGSGVTRIRLGSTVLTTNNYGTTLDAAYVNVGESPGLGDITGSFTSGFSVNAVQNNSVDLGTDTVGNYVANLGTLVGLSTSGNTGEGSTPGLSVLYGSGANNAAAGANTFTCATGSGNLAGGGTIVTIGTSGTTCGTISTNNAVTFSTSVTSPLFTGSGAVTLSSGGSSGLTLDSASNTISIAANDTTLQRVAAGTYTIDLSDASATTLRLTNSGTGVANLDIFKGGLSTAGTTRLTNGGALQNITGLTITSGGASITGALNLNNGGITNIGSIAGATTVNASGLVTSVGLTAGSGLIQGTGGLTITGATNINTSGATAVNIGNASTPLTITSTGFKTTSAGALSGITTLNASGNITGGSLTAGNGANRSCSNSQFVNGMTVTDGIVTATNGCTAPLSDARLKQNVVSLDDSILSRIKDVNTVNFDFDCSNSIFDTTKSDGIYCDSQRQTGVIAQELATIFPELVHQYDNGYYWADYEGLSIYTLKAVSEIAKHLNSNGDATLNAVTANSLTVVGDIKAGTIRADRIEGLEYNGRFESLEQRVSTIEQKQTAPSSPSQPSAGSENVTAKDLTVGGTTTLNGPTTIKATAKFEDNVTINGQTEVEGLTVNMNLIARGTLEVNGTATFKEMARFEKDAQFDGQINVLGYTNTQGLTVNLDLIVKGALEVNGPATFKEMVRFQKDAQFDGNVAVKGQTTFNSDTAGYATIKAGDTSVKVKFTKPKTAKPVISLTLGDGKFAQYSYKNVTEEEFEIVLAAPSLEDLTFSWVAVSAEQPVATAPVQNPAP